MNGEGYRKGYREGWLAAIHHLKELVENRRLSFSEAYTRCYDYRKRLHEWTLKPPNGAAHLHPPALED